MLISALFRLLSFKFNAFVGLLLRLREWNFARKKKTFGQTGREPFFDLIVHLSWCMVFICFSSVCLLFVCAKETHFLKVFHLQHNKELLISSLFYSTGRRRNHQRFSQSSGKVTCGKYDRQTNGV